MVSNTELRSNVIIVIVRKLIIYSLVYYIGYINWSFSWIVIPIVLSTVTKRARIINTNRRKFAKEAADGNEKKIILENIKDLPAWVHFPDTERAEWLNKIVKQFWPFINHLTRDIMKNHVEHKFRKQFEKYALGGFHFDSIILGSVPLRTGGIIVYENVSRNEVVMDIELSYTGDCDVKFRLKGLLGSMQNFQLRGKLRIILKPLIQHVPLVGGLQIFFLNNPGIDFDLDGMAGILNIPGAKAILRKCFCDTVASLMVLPNKFSIRFTKEVSTEILITPNPVGVLRVHVIQAKDLLKKDITLTGKGMSDPYAVLTVGEQTYKTGTIECTDNPKWDYWCEFVVLEHTGQELVINVWDEDNTEDEFLGRISVEIVDLMKTGQTGLCLNLQDVKHGEIHLKTTWLTLTTDYDNWKAAIYESQQLQVAHMSSALLIVFIDSATNLKQVRVSTKPNPYIQLHLGTQLKHTNTVKRSINPVWEEGFIFLVGNPESDFLNLKMIDSKTEAELYAINYNISLLFNKKNLEVEKDVVTMESGRNDCKLVWSLHLKVFHNENFQEYMKQYPAPVASSDKTLERLDSDSFSNESSEHEKDIFDKSTDSVGSFMISDGSSVASRFFGKNLGEINLTLRYSLQRQRLIVVIHRIGNLFHGESDEEKDIYVKLYLLPERSKATKRKSKVIKLFGDPIFDERFEFLIPQDGLNSKSLEISVIEEKMIKNEIIGQVTLSMGEINFPHTGSFDLSARDE